MCKVALSVKISKINDTSKLYTDMNNCKFSRFYGKWKVNSDGYSNENSSNPQNDVMIKI